MAAYFHRVEFVGGYHAGEKFMAHPMPESYEFPGCMDVFGNHVAPCTYRLATVRRDGKEVREYHYEVSPQGACETDADLSRAATREC